MFREEGEKMGKGRGCTTSELQCWNVYLALCCVVGTIGALELLLYFPQLLP